MSGSSTLRLVCLAAMAPALTEAASSTRLKLQDPSNKHCGDSVPAKIDRNSIKVSRYSSSQTEESFSKPGSDLDLDLDLYCPKGSLKSTDDRLAHLSISNGKQIDQVQGRWPPPTTGTGSKGVGLALTSASPTILSKPINIKRLNDLNLNGNSIPSLIDLKEDITAASCTHSKDSHPSKSEIIDSFKRMNQPQLVADKDKAGIVKISHRFSTEAKTKTIKFEKISLVKHSGMVNGANGLKGGGDKKEELDLSIDCYKESGDAPDKKNGIDVTLLSDKIHAEAKGLVELMSLKNKMGMCVKESYVPTQVDTVIKTMGSSNKDCMKSCDDLRKECVKKQLSLERKVDTLLRRLKRTKGKVVESHTKEQLLQYVNFQHRNLQMVAKTIKNEAPGPEELKEHFLSNEEVKNMSTAQLVKLVRGYQANKPLAITEAASSRYRVLNSNTNTAIMSPSVASHSLTTAEKLTTKVQMAEADLDSDATASSSGGESGDEDASLVQLNPDVKIPSLYKRAEWKWAVDRAAVVGRWTWLQAQVSDLEYKIRQQSQVHRQLRNSKGGVVLGDPPTPVDIFRRLQGLQPKQSGPSISDGKGPGEEPVSSEVSPCNVSAVLSNVDKQATRLTQTLHCLSPASSTIGSPVGSKLSSPLVNGANDSPSSSTTTETEATADNSPLLSSSLSNFRQPFTDLSSPADASCQAARCRPLRSYRKRKILRTIGLYKTNVKAARLSDIRCRCYPPTSPCPICGGRYNNTLAMDPDGMSFNERVALLDSSFHSVLSFPQDVHLPIHCEGLLKSGLWQNKPPPKRSRVGDYRRQKVLSLVTEPVRKNGNKISSGRNNNTASMINFSTKIKNKYDGKTKGKGSIARPTALKPKGNKVKRKAAKLAREALKRKEEENDDELDEMYLDQEVSLSSGSRDHLSHSGSQSALKDMRDGHAGSQRKRRIDHSFDINNIVIPHHIAASTRVEQIQYKEIVTPKWREVEDVVLDTETVENAVSKQLGQTNGFSREVEQQVKFTLDDEEDLSDERFLNRHTMPELEEKKRFRNFLQYPPVRRHRARSDAFISCPDKDGQETQDKNEAVATVATIAEEKSAEPVSYPNTPMSMLNKSLPSSLFSYLEESSDASSPGRRRTISACRRERTGSGYEDIHSPLLEITSIEPWPRRNFPLSEEEFEQIQNDAPPNCEPVHQRVTRRLAEPSGKVYVGCASDQVDEGSTSRVESRATSPLASNESVSSSVGEDPNDPEWLSATDMPRKGKGRKSVVDDADPDWTGSDVPKKFKKR